MPSLIVRQEQLAPDRSLRRQHLEQARDILRSGGLLLLPSDTCYSLAGNIHDTRVPDLVTRILARARIPFSTTAHSIAVAQQWIDMPDEALRLLQDFAPGPITLICRAHRRHAGFTESQIRSTDRTIGIRIPSSIIEREITGAMAQDEMITTTAVRDPVTGQSIREFAKAFDIVRSSIESLDRSFAWGAIQRDTFLDRDSVLVRYDHLQRDFEILPRPDSDEIARPGRYSFAEITRILERHAERARHPEAAP